KLRWRKLIVVSLATACFGTLALERLSSTRDESEVSKMMEKKKTVCVGRYLVDVPVGAEISFSGGMLAGFDIDVVEESKAAFSKRVAARKAEIESLAADAGPSGPSGLLETRDLHVSEMVWRSSVVWPYSNSWYRGWPPCRSFVILGGRL